MFKCIAFCCLNIENRIVSVFPVTSKVLRDLKSPEGVALVKELVVKSDILIENYRPGVMDRLGLGYETLKTLNPGLIYCAISGFGHPELLVYAIPIVSILPIIPVARNWAT